MDNDYFNWLFSNFITLKDIADNTIIRIWIFISQFFSFSYFRLILLLIPLSISIFALLFKLMTQKFRITYLLIEKCFPGLSKKQIKTFSKRIKKGAFPKGSLIVSQGEPAKECFILQNGNAQVFANYAEVGQTKLAELNSGDLFGEMGLLEGRLRSATIIASQNCDCIRIDAATFSEFITGNTKDSRSKDALDSIREMALTRNKTNKAWLRFKD